LSESITRNPFDERFTGVLFGFMMALPQFFYNRACFLNYREAIGQQVPQLVIDEELEIALEDDELFQGRPSGSEGPGGKGHHLVGSRFSFEAQGKGEAKR